MFESTLKSAQEFTKEGRLEEWVHEFLCGEGNNKELSFIIKKYTHWLKPKLVNESLALFRRIIGNEPDMEYRKTEEEMQWFWEHVNAQVNSFKHESWNMPPLIAGDKADSDGFYKLCDGNHRFEALKKLGFEQYWFIQWEPVQYYANDKIKIRPMDSTDAKIFAAEEIAQGWQSTADKHNSRLREMRDGKCIILVGEWDDMPAGYVSVYPQSKNGAFRCMAEIVDFNVLEKFRRHGIGTKLMDVAERIAANYSDVVCLSVGLMSSYGAAQRMYVKRGYIPDGSGVWHNGKICEPYHDCKNDDELVLYLIKSLS